MKYLDLLKFKLCKQDTEKAYFFSFIHFLSNDLGP